MHRNYDFWTPTPSVRGQPATWLMPGPGDLLSRRRKVGAAGGLSFVVTQEGLWRCPSATQPSWNILPFPDALEGGPAEPPHPKAEALTLWGTQGQGCRGSGALPL